MKQVTYIKVFVDYLDAIAQLNDRERGRLFTALLEYARSGQESELSGNEKYVFPMMRAQLDRDRELYDDVVEKRRCAGRTGGRPKKASSEDGGEQPPGETKRAKARGGQKAKKANAFEKSKCSQDKDKDEDDDDDDEEEDDEEKDFLSITTTKSGHTRTYSAGEDGENGGVDEWGVISCDGEAGGEDLRCGRSGEDGGSGQNGGAGFVRIDADEAFSRGAPVTPQAAMYFRDEHFLDDPVREARRFIAYNEHRGWDCLPDWRYAADLWVTNLEVRERGRPPHSPQ